MTEIKNVQIELHTPHVLNSMEERDSKNLFDYQYDNIEKKGNYAQKYQSKNRKITSNRPDYQLPDNSIQTSKYTLLNFFPKQLFEQFSKLANVYFVLMGALQMVPEVSISSGIPTIYLPLGFIILVSGAKDFYEDYKRRTSDNEENKQQVTAFDGKDFVKIPSYELRVGHIVKVNQDEIISADMILLRSSEKKGICYVETKSLDGETNLKQKNVHVDLLQTFKSDDCFGQLDKRIILKYQAPTPYLYKFIGETTTSNLQVSSINFNNFLLRGCNLRNVKYVFGLVAYTGHDTKIMMNSYKARTKRSKLEVKMQQFILIIFITQFIMCIIASLVYSITYFNNRQYLNYLYIGENTSEYTIPYNFFVRFGNWMLIFNNFVPISLLVTLEMVKFIQGKIMTLDEKLNQPRVQTSNLNEELGQIEHIFSDKTGTLTCNIMEFKQIIIGNQNYGDILRSSDDYIRDDELLNYPQVSNVDFRDKTLMQAINDKNHIMHDKVEECLKMISICHTVISDQKDGKLIYNATSPDELALLNFARFVGFEFLGTDENNIKRISYQEQIIEYQLLEMFEFTSARKRQSILVQVINTGDIYLFSKGADSVLLDQVRLSKEELNKNEYHQLVQRLQEYGKIGLRTLVLSKRKLSKQEYEEWHKRYQLATQQIENREEKMQVLQDELEKNYEILGATAIEDKLQQDVADTIAAVKAAGIKVWVLTGDKIETAINIGYSCSLLTNNLVQHIVDEKEELLINERLDDILNKIPTLQTTQGQALIISGDALLHALKPDIQKKVAEVCGYCEVVLCCRVSPKQKQDVVSLIRGRNQLCSTLAIGDGANDVNMITAAHVGVGIRGVEGQQAARAADYSVQEFRELRRLLFFHGRECYRRNSVLVCYTFYKNILVVLPQFWYGILSMYSAQSLYDTFIYQLFNILYGALPIMIYGIFDEEYDADQLTDNKLQNYYQQGPQGVLFNIQIVLFWVFCGFWQAAILCFFPTYTISENFVENSGFTHHLWAQGTMIFGLIVVICNLKVLLFSNTYTPALLGSISFSMISYLLSWIILDNIPQAEAYVVFQSLFQTPNFHFGNILVIAAICSIDIALNIKLNRVLQKVNQNTSIKTPFSLNNLSIHQPPKIGGKLNNKAHTGFAFNCLDRDELEDQDKIDLYGIDNQVQSQNG
ncbi:unnamed protein product [Paramecium primaurelia]|uniref:Phospholipid-transporting ATPase n=1 Tax=Paramecium primaurelia TaxID=5886 RepID=A0A8S1MWE9_PARPR|nr:unnamed protein product [Paramecium primaurelia]